ncbi:methionine synthase I [Amylibacter kogurei]|uniref:Methionine synthase I n=1 Tax=Paramylibacter kogurei TaxID=1889778 RepID=A0A2G5K7J4_9RHOB|nr:holin family protein [Amylibacter kogurei]PIB24830.1 methionine synthase I [Amylibacter kogurei]
MGLIGKILGVGKAVERVGRTAERVSEVFVPNKTEKQKQEYQQYRASLDQYAQEFTLAPMGLFNSFVNGLNRLPRPMLAFGTMGLFVFAMINPAAFSLRMVGLNQVPEPLWWLLGAIVSFYFGAREMHHFRSNTIKIPQNLAPMASFLPMIQDGALDPDYNAALEDWRKQQK